MLRRSLKHPISHWRLWQVFPTLVFAAGVFGILPGLIPPFSISAFWIGIGLAALAIPVGLWNWWTYNWWARLTILLLWTVQILLLASRGWSQLIPIIWIWLVPILGAYVVAWLLPALNPVLSGVLWREQWCPETRMGRAIMGVVLAVGPSAGVLGASFGLYGSRFGEANLVYLALATLGSMAAIGIAFANAYVLWPERPWAKQAGSSKQS